MMKFILDLVAAFIPMRPGTRGTSVCFSGIVLMFAVALWAPGIKEQPELRSQILGPTGSITVLTGLAVVRRIASKAPGAAAATPDQP